MSVKPIIALMNKLGSLHQSLLTLSKEKTEHLKEGNMADLQSLLVTERKHIQAINQVESEREKLAHQWFQARGLQDQQPTVSAMLAEVAVDKEKDQLQAAFEQLIYVLAELKQQEQLNQQLTQQSLQFVELSMDMLQPSMKNMNYGKPNAKGTDTGSKRSLFDSKA